MRTNGANQSLLGGVSAGVYPAILDVHGQDSAAFENYRAGDATNGYAIPSNFIAAPQALITAMASEVADKYSGGNHLVNDAESTKWRFGKWVAPLKAKYIKISPLGKARSDLITDVWPKTNSLVKSVAISTSKICFVWPVYLASGQYAFYMRAASFGAAGVTWGAVSRVGTCISNDSAANRWAIAKQSTDKVIIYFSNQANSNYFSAIAFSISTVTYGSAGSILQIAATASAAIWSACNAGTDKSVVATNITDFAYCCTTSTLTITAGSGVDIITTPTGLQVILQYMATDTVMAIYGNVTASGGMYARVLTIATRTITANAEASGTTGGGVNMTALNVQMASATMGVGHYYGSSYNNFYLALSVSGTTVTITTIGATNFPPHGTTDISVLAADTTNSEIWGVGAEKIYKLKISGTTFVCVTTGKEEYEFESLTLGLYTTNFSTSNAHQQYISSYANGNAVLAYGLYNGYDPFKIVLNMASKIRVDITINGTLAYDATAAANGQICAINQDISSLGYAEVTLTNNAGYFAGFMLDQILITCT